MWKRKKKLGSRWLRWYVFAVVILIISREPKRKGRTWKIPLEPSSNKKMFADIDGWRARTDAYWPSTVMMTRGDVSEKKVVHCRGRLKIDFGVCLRMIDSADSAARTPPNHHHHLDNESYFPSEKKSIRYIPLLSRVCFQNYLSPRLATSIGVRS